MGSGFSVGRRSEESPNTFWLSVAIWLLEPVEFEAELLRTVAALERREFLDQLLQSRAEPVVLDGEHPKIGFRLINIVDRFEAFEVRHGLKMPAQDPTARSFSERSSGETLKRPMR